MRKVNIPLNKSVTFGNIVVLHDFNFRFKFNIKKQIIEKWTTEIQGNYAYSENLLNLYSFQWSDEFQDKIHWENNWKMLIS